MRRLLIALAAMQAAFLAPLAGAHPPPARERRVEAADILMLNELGVSRTGLALSPDGTRVAVMQRRVLLEENNYQHDLIVLEATANAASHVIGDGGGFLLHRVDGRATGSDIPRIPQWSPDGGWIAYLAERDGRAELWLSSSDGEQRRRIAGADADVERFAWVGDSRALVIETLTPRAVLSRRLSDAQALGFRVDERFAPGFSLLPRPDEASGRRTLTIDLDGGARQANDEDIRLLAAQPSQRTSSAHVAPVDPQRSVRFPLTQVLWTDADGVLHPCTLQECRGDILAAWASSDGAEIYFQAEEGPARDLNAFYAWRVGNPGSVRLIRRAEERMMACDLAGARLVCLQEFSTQPRRIVSLDSQTGDLATIYDPNPRWAEFTLPRIERLDLPAGRYEASYAHLVYPNDYRPGRRYPLIVVQYHSRGFLRWGVGWQMPIFAAAARGYFVLSVDRPEARALGRVMGGMELEAAIELDGAEIGMKLDQIDRLTDGLVARGLIDPSRIALTGMSDGAETLYAALTRGTPYGAASVGSQPTDALNWHLTSEEHRNEMRGVGLTGPWPDSPAPWGMWWQERMATNHADVFQAPMMFHLSESEALFAFPLITRLTERGLPVETYIYPGAYHLKWRPQQILAMHERSLAWFDFWLRHDNRRISAEDLRRWSAMREARVAED